MAANPRALPAVNQLLLHHCLPTLEAGLEQGSSSGRPSSSAAVGQEAANSSARDLKLYQAAIGELGSLLPQACLAPVILQHMRRPGGAVLMRQAVRIALALPVPRP
jgi:hypothetical protein